MSPWWRDAVVYQIYPRSFADGNGDGVGDLEGIRRHLDHVAWLGADAIWISPFYRSPMADFGYDVSDYCDVDPLFGTLGDAEALIGEAHDRGLRVLVDWVPNHTSDQHPWFVDARAGRDAEHRSWYIWRDPAPDGGPPNNWVGTFGHGPAWTFDEASGQYYLHLFLPEQPDLNWAEPAVEAAMHDTLRFWLDRGVDGFRMDVVHLIGKDPDLPDDPEELAGLTHVVLNHRDETHALLRRIRTLLDGYDGERTSVGEVYLLDTGQVATYYGDDDELHLCFNFPPLYAPWRANAWRHQIETTEAELEARGAWPTWVLSNHDNVRHRTRFGGGEARARAAAVLLLTLRGTPFLYAGEELGMDDAVVADDQRVDPGGRDGCRAPFPWDASPTHGWTGATPWLPFAPASDRRNVATLREDPSSILHLYRHTIAERRASAALTTGSLRLLDAPDGVVAFERRAGDDRRIVAISFADEPVRLDTTTFAGRVAVHSGEGEVGGPFDGVLPPDTAVVLDPTR